MFLLGWNENLQPHGPLLDQFDTADLKQCIMYFVWKNQTSNYSKCSQVTGTVFPSEEKWHEVDLPQYKYIHNTLMFFAVIKCIQCISSSTVIEYKFYVLSLSIFIFCSFIVPLHFKNSLLNYIDLIALGTSYFTDCMMHQSQSISNKFILLITWCFFNCLSNHHIQNIHTCKNVFVYNFTFTFLILSTFIFH